VKSCLYSPLPVKSYYLQGRDNDAVRTIINFDEGPSIWNLLWLSYPKLDNIPGSGLNWTRVYISSPDLFSAAIHDVNEYATLAQMLKEHPAKFAKWFAKEDHKAWHCYAIGGEDWVSTVLARAQEAVNRVWGNVKVEGNVIRVQFGGKR
jgi:hypothetical protein